MMPAELFRRLKPLYGAQIERLWVEYQTADVPRKQEIEELLIVLGIKRLGMMIGDERLVLDAPPADLIGRGSILLGHVSYPGLAPYPLRVARKELLRHTFILGPTGTGKSTLLLSMLQQLLALRVPFMAFDFKRNYRCLLHAPGAAGLVVFSVGRSTAPLALNALQPPRGVEVEEWAAALSDIISTSYLLMQGARNVLKDALLRAHETHGRGATLAHAHALVSAALDATKPGSRRYGWLESSTRSLEELTKGSFGGALNAINGTPIEALLDRSVIFELQGFGDDQKRCFCLLLLQAILLLRKTSGALREILRHVLVFDEAHNVFPRERPGEVSIPARLAREVREFGEGIISATQQADVSESLIANSGIKLILRCDYPKDVAFASALLQIDGRWLPRLPLGSGIARLPVRYYTPILFTFPEQPLKNRPVSDALVHEAWRQHDLPAPSTPRPPPVLTDRERDLLHDVAAQPISMITQRYERLGWNYKTGNAIKDSVIAKGFATFDPVPTPTGQVKILSLTDRARDLLDQAGVRVARSRHGGAAHEYWKHIIAVQMREQGFTVTEEYAVGGGKAVDLYAVRDERMLAVEVETGRSDIMANVAKCAGLGVEVIFVFTDAPTRSVHEAAIRAALPTVRLLSTADVSGRRWSAFYAFPALESPIGRFSGRFTFPMNHVVANRVKNHYDKWRTLRYEQASYATRFAFRPRRSTDTHPGNSSFSRDRISNATPSSGRCPPVVGC